MSGLLIWLLWPRGEAEAAWYNSSWAYRKAITITNNGSLQSNYTIEVTVDTQSLISAGKLQSDCDDIIFTYSDGYTTQSYFVNYCSNTSGVNSSFFVKVSSIATSGTTTIYMYYGNSGASSGASTYSTVGAPAGVWLGTGKDCSVCSTANLAANGKGIFLTNSSASGCMAAGDKVILITVRGDGTSPSTGDGLYEFGRAISTNGTAVFINYGLANNFNDTKYTAMR